MLMKSVMAIAFRSQADANVRRHTVKLEHVSVRVYEPVSEHAGAGMLFIHGGGYVMGQARMNDPDCNRIVREIGMSVVSVDYRLAPKHPYPAPLDDCYKAWLWFLDEGAPQPAAQLLYYPMIDDRTATRGDLTPVRHIAWNNENNFFGWSAYLGHPPDDGSEIPRWAVPSRRPDLSNLPPAWIGVGDKDLFYGENLDYAERLSKDGVESELEIVEDVPHGFDALAPEADISRDFREASFDFLRRRLGIDS